MGLGSTDVALSLFLRLPPTTASPTVTIITLARAGVVSISTIVSLPISRPAA
jgi:hypothetical protein